MDLNAAALLVALLVTATTLVLFIWQAVRYFRQDRDERSGGDDGGS
jgi:hypothetical protein